MSEYEERADKSGDEKENYREAIYRDQEALQKMIELDRERSERYYNMTPQQISLELESSPRRAEAEHQEVATAKSGKEASPSPEQAEAAKAKRRKKAQEAKAKREREILDSQFNHYQSKYYRQLKKKYIASQGRKRSKILHHAFSYFEDQMRVQKITFGTQAFVQALHATFPPIAWEALLKEHNVPAKSAPKVVLQAPVEETKPKSAPKPEASIAKPDAQKAPKPAPKPSPDLVAEEKVSEASAQTEEKQSEGAEISPQGQVTVKQPKPYIESSEGGVPEGCLYRREGHSEDIYYYKVAPGETLTKIGKKLHVSIDQIQEANWWQEIKGAKVVDLNGAERYLQAREQITIYRDDLPDFRWSYYEVSGSEIKSALFDPRSKMPHTMVRQLKDLYEVYNQEHMKIEIRGRNIFLYLTPESFLHFDRGMNTEIKSELGEVIMNNHGFRATVIQAENTSEKLVHIRSMDEKKYGELQGFSKIDRTGQLEEVDFLNWDGSFEKYQNTRKTKPQDLEVAPATDKTFAVYKPEYLIHMMEAAMLGDDNQLTASGQISFKILVNGQYLVFFIQVRGSVGIQVGVGDDRSFSTQLNWSVGVEAGAKLTDDLSVSGSADYTASMGYFDILNGRFESVRHFAAMFHHSMFAFCQSSNLRTDTFGISSRDTYWRENAHELRKGFIKEDKRAIDLEAKAEASELGGVSVKHNRTAINRTKYGGTQLGEHIKKAPGTKTKRGSEITTTGRITVGVLNIEFIKMDVDNDPNSDNNDNAFDIKVYAKSGVQWDTSDGVSITQKVKTIKDRCSVLMNGVGLIKDAIPLIKSKLAPIILEVLNLKNSSDPKSFGRIEESYGLNLHWEKEDDGWALHYVRLYNEKETNVEANAKVVGGGITATAEQSLLEYAGGGTVSHFSMIYNSTMGEFAALQERSRVNKGLDKTSEDRKDEATAQEALDSVWQNYQGKHSCPDWEEYKHTHKGELEGIINALSSTVKASIGDDAKWDKAMVAGINLSDEFGRSREAKEKPFVKVLINPMSSIEVKLEYFEKEILFKLYKENTAYRYDFWK